MKKVIGRVCFGGFYPLLRDVVYPKVKDNSFTHDEFFVKYRFPTKRDGLFFIGEALTENDEPLHPEHSEVLKQHINA